MELDESQIFANISSGLANLVASGIISREQAKELIKPFFWYDKRVGQTKSSNKTTKVKIDTVGTSDVK